MNLAEENNVMAVSSASISGQWIQASDGRWWYRHSDGTYTKSNWEEVTDLEFRNVGVFDSNGIFYNEVDYLSSSTLARTYFYSSDLEEVDQEVSSWTCVQIY